VPFLAEHPFSAVNLLHYCIVTAQGANPRLATICSGEKDVVLLKMRLLRRHNWIQYIEEGKDVNKFQI
jgi:hypothetical protein